MNFNFLLTSNVFLGNVDRTILFNGKTPEQKFNTNFENLFYENIDAAVYTKKSCTWEKDFL